MADTAELIRLHTIVTELVRVVGDLSEAIKRRNTQDADQNLVLRELVVVLSDMRDELVFLRSEPARAARLSNLQTRVAQQPRAPRKSRRPQGDPT